MKNQRMLGIYLRLLNNKIGGRTTELTLVDIPLLGE